TILAVLSAHAAQRQETKGKAGEVAPSLRPVAAQLASGAEQALRQGDYPAAIRGFEALVKMPPRVAEFRANLGMAYYSAREFPDDPDLLYLSSHVYSDLSTLASERLLSTAPGSVQAHQMNAEILEFQGKPEEAAKEYRKILASNPNLPGIHYRLGRALLAGPQNATAQEEARREFEEELKINPVDALSEYELGEMARKVRQWNEAIERFSRAVKADRTLPDARHGQG